MDLSLYIPGQTILHKLPAWVKFLVLLVVSILAYWVEGLAVFILTFLGALGLVAYVNILKKRHRKVIVFPLVMVILFSIFSAFVVDPDQGLVTFFRLSSLVMLAACVTVTTKSDAFIAMIERTLLPLSIFPFIKPKAISLTISLTLRFIPTIFKLGMDIREAQAARGLQSNPIALIVPLIVLTLKHADDVSDALDARMIE
jgi:biotin transport system permease protein